MKDTIKQKFVLLQFYFTFIAVVPAALVIFDLYVMGSSQGKMCRG